MIVYRLPDPVDGGIVPRQWALSVATGCSLSGHQTASSCLPPPPLPRRHRLWISPQSSLSLSCFLLQSFEDDIARRIRPIPPAPALLDEFLIDVCSIRQDYVSKGALVLVLAVRLKRDFFPKARAEAACLALLP